MPYYPFVYYVIGFGLGLTISLLMTAVVMRLASYFNIVATSRFGIGYRLRVPLLGGLAIFSAFAISVGIVWSRSGVSGDILDKHLIGLMLGAGWLMVGGFIDDKYNISPRFQMIWPLLAVLTVIVSGIGITYITNPLKPESLIYLNTIQYNIFWWQGLPYRITFFADIFTLIWLIGIMYATKLQDGLDGLVSGMSFIVAVALFLISWFIFRQMDLAFLTIIFAAVMLGFLYFNRYPARIYLGEGGSLFAGYVLGIMAILSDAKVVITIMILALPIFDIMWTIVRRLKRGQPFWQGDTEHLHHRLVKLGFSQSQAVWFLYGITAFFGLLVLLWQSSFAFYSAGLIILIVLISTLIFKMVYQKKVI